MLVFSTGSLSCIFASRLESAGECSQAQHSIMYWVRLPEEFLAQLWARQLSVFQAVPEHGSSSTVFLCKVFSGNGGI